MKRGWADLVRPFGLSNGGVEFGVTKVVYGALVWRFMWRLLL